MSGNNQEPLLGETMLAPQQPHELIASRKLLQASALCATFMVVEIVCGYLASSLALMTDAAHLLSDLASFGISFFALWITRFPGTCDLSFGYHRAEIIGACFSVLCIWVATAWLVYAAIHRVLNPVPVDGRLMFITAAFGTAANLFMTHILSMHSHGLPSFHTEQKHGHGCCHGHGHGHSAEEETGTPATIGSPDARDFGVADEAGPVIVIPEVRSAHVQKEAISLRAAYIHAVGDLLQNLGVLLAALIIWIRPSASIADPICTLIFSVLVLYTTVSILREAVSVLMEGTPTGFSPQQIKQDLESLPHVGEVHDLHVWSLSVAKPALVCHLVINEEARARDVLAAATQVVQEQHGILHTTIQVEFDVNQDSCGTVSHTACHQSSIDCCCAPGC